jgi:hypothetical protein
MRFVIGIVTFYQRVISPLLPQSCRYEPTCSEYFKQSLLKKGLIRGTWAGTLRILRCNPFFRGGYDPP